MCLASSTLVLKMIGLPQADGTEIGHMEEDGTRIRCPKCLGDEWRFDYSDPKIARVTCNKCGSRGAVEGKASKDYYTKSEGMMS